MTKQAISHEGKIFVVDTDKSTAVEVGSGTDLVSEGIKAVDEAMGAPVKAVDSILDSLFGIK